MTVVALPLVNEWTQDRDHAARRTPRWRGITLFHELRRRACMLCSESLAGFAPERNGTMGLFRARNRTSLMVTT